MTDFGASKHANCLMFEDEAISPIFSLKWSKNRAPLVDNFDDDIAEKDLASLPHIDEMSPYIGSIIAYIGGYIVDKIEEKLSCSVCFEALLLRDDDILEYDDASKNRGGLTFPSNDVVRILKTCEQVFRCNVSGNDFSNPEVKIKHNLKLKLRNKAMRDLPGNIFTCLDEHDFSNEFGMAEDLHSTQLTKKIIDYYFRIRLLRYGQYVSQIKLKKGKEGMRQQSNKLILFNGL